MDELITWHPPTVIPDHDRRCLVHAINDWYIVAVYDIETNQFWDKDGQPVVGVREWSYRPNREI